MPSILYKQLTYEDLQHQNWKNKVRAKRKGNSEEINKKRDKKDRNKVRWKLGGRFKRIGLNTR